MKWIILALVVLAVVAVVRRVRAAQSPGAVRRGQDAGEQLAAVRRAADEDVTVFGEELQRLDAELAGSDLDEGTRADYQRALDAYEAAKESLAAVRHPDEVRHVTEILEDGRYAAACVRARVTEQPLPTRRAPCFFNPQHGPSVRDVSWAPAGGVRRDVPACALDAERVEAGAEPDARKVLVGARRVPYWDAGSRYSPWAAGYYGSFGLMTGLFAGTMLAGGLDGGEGYDDGSSGGDSNDDGAGYEDVSDGSDGYDAGSDTGGWDGGGFDGGGWGGFDGGGFDGGGF